MKTTGIRTHAHHGRHWLKRIFLALLLAIPAFAHADLILTAPPRESAAVSNRLYGPLAEHLTRLLGRRVVYEYPKTWLHYERDIRAGRYDIVFDGPQFISWLNQQFGYRPVAKLPGTLRFFVITGKADTAVETIDDLAGRRVCFIASPDISALTLLKEFDDPIRQPWFVNIQGDMRAVFKAFQTGRCKAAVLSEAFYTHALTDQERAAVRVIHRTDPVTNQGIAVSTRLSESELEKLRTDLSRGNPALAPLLERFAPGRSAMEPATAADYAGYHRLLTGVIFGWELDRRSAGRLSPAEPLADRDPEPPVPDTRPAGGSS